MGWNGSGQGTRAGGATGKAPKAERRPGSSRWRGIAAGTLAVLAVAAAVLLWLNRDGEHAQEPRGDKPAGSRTPIEARRPAAPAVAAPQEQPKAEAGRPPRARILGKTPTGEEFVAVEASTNSTGVVESMYTLSDGSKKRVVVLQSRDTLVFDNDFDNMLGLIGTTPLDQKLPPMPDIGDMEEQFKKAVKTPIVIREGDSEHVKKMKEAARDLRLEITYLMSEGYTLTQILSEYETLRERNVKERHAFQSELNRIYNSGDVDGAREYLEKANQKLEEFGIIPLTMPGEGPKRRTAP